MTPTITPTQDGTYLIKLPEGVISRRSREEAEAEIRRLKSENTERRAA